MWEEQLRAIVDVASPQPPETWEAVLAFGRRMETEGFWLVGHEMDGDCLVLVFASADRRLRVPVLDLLRPHGDPDSPPDWTAWSVSEGGDS